MQLHVKGANLYYERHHANRGPAVVLIHGAGDNTEAWYLNLPLLTPNYDVLTLDVRGHGKTEVLDGDYSNEAVIEDIRQLLDNLDIRQAALVGYSMGAGLAAGFAATYPDRTLAAVLSNGVQSPEPPTPEQQQQMQQRREAQTRAVQQGGMEQLFTERIASGNTFTQEFAQRETTVLARYRDIVLANNPQEYLKRMQTFMGGGRPAYDQITAPTLIIVGEHDSFSSPAVARQVAALMKHARVEAFPTAHFTAMEMPQEWGRVVYGFLQQHAPGG
ncbi:MAG: alpha/beta hydrolase [Chloroflexi bacterium]|nr:alpha/beta hydrolase [Chloroflexota bacterium]